MRFVILILAFLIFKPSLGQGESAIPESDSLSYKPRILGLPILFYLPETRLGFGGAGFFSFKTNRNDTTLRPSQINLGAAYTLEKQILSYIDYDVWAANNKINLHGELGYYHFFYYFWGVGEEPRQQESFVVNFPRIRFEGYYEISDGLFLGPKYTYDFFDIVEREEGGRLIDNNYPGSDGGGISGIGLTSKYDTRDNNFYPTKGYNSILSYEYFSEAYGSDFNYHLIWANFIKYFDLGEDRVIGVNAYGRFSNGEVPFFHMSQVGGSNRMRGYYEGFHRDNHKIGWEVEYRTPLFWRFGLSLFAGNAVVADKVSRFKTRNLNTAAGAGLRFKLDEERKINLRLDFGVTSDRTTGFYFTIGEAF